MGEVVKYIKIKKEDGTLTEKVPIGAEAKNVVLDNGNSVEFELKNNPYYFNTIEEVINADYLQEGDIVKTLGYYSINDGGAANYKITKTKKENTFQISLSEKLYGDLIIDNDEIFPEQMGAHGHIDYDDTLILQKILDIAAMKQRQPRIKLLNKTYTISNLILKPRNNLVGSGIDNTTLLCKSGSSGSIISITANAWHYCYLADMTISCRTADNTIENAILIDVENPSYDSFSTFENIRIHYIPNGNGIWNRRGGRECRFNNIFIREAGGYGLIAGSSDSLYNDITSNHNYKAGIWNTGSNNRFVNCKAYVNGYGNAGINRYELSGFYCTGIISSFTACDAQENYGDGFYVANSRNIYTGCKADANGISVQTGNDENLVYSGFYISSSYTGSSIEECSFVIETDDFRRSTGRQAQKYGIDINQLVKSNIFITSKNQVQDIYYGTGYAINNSNFANNYIVLNGNYYGNTISNRLTLKKLGDFKDWIDIYDGDNSFYRLDTNGRLQFNYFGSGSYTNTPLKIRGDAQYGYIQTDPNYILRLKCKSLGFFSSDGVAKQTANANATDLASAISLVNNLKAILQNYGMIN